MYPAVNTCIIIVCILYYNKLAGACVIHRYSCCDNLETFVLNYVFSFFQRIYVTIDVHFIAAWVFKLHLNRGEDS